jgi:uncharacterized membrane protein
MDKQYLSQTWSRELAGVKSIQASVKAVLVNPFTMALWG